MQMHCTLAFREVLTSIMVFRLNGVTDEQTSLRTNNRRRRRRNPLDPWCNVTKEREKKRERKGT